MANGTDLDQTAPLGDQTAPNLGLHCLIKYICPNLEENYGKERNPSYM